MQRTPMLQWIVDVVIMPHNDEDDNEPIIELVQPVCQTSNLVHFNKHISTVNLDVG